LGSPGQTPSIDLLSVGLRCGVIETNDGVLTSGTMITVPASLAGSIRGISRCIAMMVVYSVPCWPAMKATTGPGRTPWITATEIDIPESEPAGTTI